jgi:vacuolar-type H+-ATPase subunit E/Vma4
MQTITEAVVDKVKEQAQRLVNEAEEESKKELDKARAQRAARLDAEKRRLLAEATEEAARITAQNAMKARQKVANAKTTVLGTIVQKAQASLQKQEATDKQMSRLILDAIAGLGSSDKVFVSVAKKDVALAREVVKSNKDISARVLEVNTIDCDGGIIVENESRTLSVDNTYATRLQMLLPRILPEISKELF